jgi:hypothetical protein
LRGLGLWRNHVPYYLFIYFLKKKEANKGVMSRLNLICSSATFTNVTAGYKALSINTALFHLYEIFSVKK